MKHGYILFTEPEQNQRLRQQMHKWCKAGFVFGGGCKEAESRSGDDEG